MIKILISSQDETKKTQFTLKYPFSTHRLLPKKKKLQIFSKISITLQCDSKIFFQAAQIRTKFKRNLRRF